jgi:hypothetical protein
MGQLLSSALLLVAAALAQTPSGELPTGSRLAHRPQLGPTLTTKDQTLGAKELAACLYDRHEEVARATLLAPSKDAEERAASRLAGKVECYRTVFGNDMVDARIVHFPHDILRGMLAERGLQKLKSQAAALPALPLQKVYQRPWFAVTSRHVSVDEMGACIADTNPAGIVAVMRTVPTSKEEGAAFGAMGDQLGKCLRAGTRLQANRQSLRAALADALFQRLYAPAPASSPTVGAAKH